MRAILRTIGLAVFSLILTCSPSWAWEIKRFDASLAVQSECSLIVRETIHVDFQGEERHGIFRDIPTVTQDRFGRRHAIRLQFLEAVDEDNQPWEVQFTRHGAYQRIRLGSSQRTYQGRKIFQLTYQVSRIIGSFPTHDELYWNVTGNEWTVPIREATAIVRLPQPVAADLWQVAAYTGRYGSTASEAKIAFSNDKEVRFDLTRSLSPMEGLTVVVGWPRGLVHQPTEIQKFLWFLQDNWMFGIPLFTLLVMGLLWWRFGRDLPRKTVAVQYEPPEGLVPAEVGTLVDDRVDLRDITATVVDLARRGYLTIEQTPKDYVFKRQRSADAEQTKELKPHEAQIFQALFPFGESTRLSDLENLFYTSLPGIRSAVYDALAKNQCWWGRPDVVRQGWWTIAGVVAFLGFFLPFAASSGEFSGPLLLSVFLSGGIIAGFAPFMPKKTWRGVRMTEQILGLEEFLRRTDQDRIRREKDPGILFERMLPYAMALGVANQWAKAFEGIYQTQPTWYQGLGGTGFSPGHFVDRLQSASNRMGTVLSSAPRSSGGSGFSGGSSGGGGGGGGGGAW